MICQWLPSKYPIGGLKSNLLRVSRGKGGGEGAHVYTEKSEKNKIQIDRYIQKTESLGINYIIDFHYSIHLCDTVAHAVFFLIQQRVMQALQNTIFLCVKNLQSARL